MSLKRVIQHGQICQADVGGKITVTQDLSGCFGDPSSASRPSHGTPVIPQLERAQFVLKVWIQVTGLAVAILYHSAMVFVDWRGRDDHVRLFAQTLLPEQNC